MNPRSWMPPTSYLAGVVLAAGFMGPGLRVGILVPADAMLALGPLLTPDADNLGAWGGGPRPGGRARRVTFLNR